MPPPLSAAASLNKPALVFLLSWHDSVRCSVTITASSVQQLVYTQPPASWGTQTTTFTLFSLLPLGIPPPKPAKCWTDLPPPTPHPAGNCNSERTVPLSHCQSFYLRSLITPQKPVPFSKSSSWLILDLSGSTSHLSTDIWMFCFSNSSLWSTERNYLELSNPPFFNVK